MDSMVHVRSDTPIQCRPPVAQSQLVNREIISDEPIEEQLLPTVNQMDTDPAFQTVETANMSSQNELCFQQPLLSPHLQRDFQISQPLHSSQIKAMAGDTQFTQAMPMTPLPVPAHLRITASFGYSPSTPESLLPLASLPSHNHGAMFGIPERSLLPLCF
jgi:hypothetical protein